MRLTLSLSSDLVRRIEKRRGKGVSRSRMVEEMLEESERAARKGALDAEISAYYGAGDPEGDAISRAAARMAKKLRIDDSPGKRRKP